MVTFVLSVERLFSVRSHCLFSGAIVLDKGGVVLRMRMEHVTQRVTENLFNLVQL